MSLFIKNNLKLFIPIIIFLLISLYQICPIILVKNQNVTAKSSWNQTTDIDFNNGTLINLTIEGENSSAELILIRDSNWIQKDPTTTPGPKAYHDLATIYGTDNILLFGYQDNFTWIYNLDEDNWIKKKPNPSPSLRSGNSLTGIWDDDKVVMCGGGTSTYYNDTWIYDFGENKWSKKSNNSIYRTNFDFVNIWGTHFILLFGGQSHDGNDFINLNDTWIYDLDKDEWKEMHPKVSPSKRNNYAMSFVYGTDNIILFGGYGDEHKNDTWIYDLSENIWVQKFPTRNPSMRASHAMTSIFGKKEVVLFGGKDSNSRLSDTWVYDYQNNIWLNEYQTNKPFSRDLHSMTQIFNTNKIILFGGQYWDNGNKNIDETWILEVNGYCENGLYITEPYDTGSSAVFKTLEWDAISQTDSDLKLQIRTAESVIDLDSKQYIGPDGSSNSYYLTSPETLWIGHNGDRWIQVKIEFIRGIDNESPCLKNFTIQYNLIPITTLKEPTEGSFINTNTPLFKWEFSDDDSNHQISFQTIISDDEEFINIIYDSQEQKSNNPSWKFPLGTSYSKLTDGIWYWKTRTKDNDGDWGDYSKPSIFVVDSTSPNSNIIYPENNIFYSSINRISGSANDSLIGSGINRVEIIIKRLFDNKYWNGTDWISSESWLITSGTDKWNYYMSGNIWDSGKQYQINSKAIDNIGNIEITYPLILFSIDYEIPSSMIEIPANNSFQNNLVRISGSSLDIGGSGIKKVEIAIKCNSDNRYWNGEQWNLEKNWLTTFGTTDWYLDTVNIEWTTNYFYNLESRTFDYANNVEILKLVSNFMYDNEAPRNIIMVINDNNQYTNSKLVNLSIEAIDKGSGLGFYKLSNNNQTWTEWEVFNDTSTFELLPNDGEKTIYTILKDNANNTAKSVYDTIILDTTPPENLSILINNGSKITNKTQVILKLNAIDKNSGIDKIMFSTDGNSWTKWQPYINEKSFILPKEDGEKVIYFKAMDKAGNICEPVFATIILNTTQNQIKNGENKNNDFNESIYLILFLFLVIFVIICFIGLLYLRKKRFKDELKRKGSKTIKPIIAKPASTSQIIQQNETLKLNLIGNQNLYSNQLSSTNSIYPNYQNNPKIIQTNIQKKIESVSTPRLPPSQINDNNIDLKNFNINKNVKNDNEKTN